ncbi:transposase [Microbispora sp. NBC_01389]|uniref:transposase n=1 Tax=Microbispora sp. NBC_01389 TaxID=2903584 RepID=UPI00386E16B7
MVCVTKYRRGAFTGPMPARYEELMREVCADFEVERREFNGEQAVHRAAATPTVTCG